MLRDHLKETLKETSPDTVWLWRKSKYDEFDSFVPVMDAPVIPDKRVSIANDITEMKPLIKRINSVIMETGRLLNEISSYIHIKSIDYLDDPRIESPFGIVETLINGYEDSSSTFAYSRMNDSDSYVPDDTIVTSNPFVYMKPCFFTNDPKLVNKHIHLYINETSMNRIPYATVNTNAKSIIYGIETIESLITSIECIIKLIPKLNPSKNSSLY